MFCFDKFNRKGAGEQVRDTVSSIKTDVRSRFLPMKHVRAADTTHISSLQRQRKSLTVVFCICVHGKQWKESRKETFTDWTNTCWHILHAVPRAGQDLLINRIFINSDNIWGILSSFLTQTHWRLRSLYIHLLIFSSPCLLFLPLPPLSPPPPSFSSSSSYPSLLPLLPHPERRLFTEGQTEPDSSSDSRFPSSPLGVW